VVWAQAEYQKAGQLLVETIWPIGAAHKTLSCGTRVRVTNLSNGQSIVVTVDNRGPFVAGRILDLTYGAVIKMNLIDKGLIKCKIETI
jgi:rare lipoprotein A